MLKAIFSVSFFNIISAGLAFIINVFLARYFSTEIYGRINLLLSVTLIINTITDFGFANSNVIFNNKFKNSFSKNELLYAINSRFKQIIPITFSLNLFIILTFCYFYSLSNYEVIFLICQGILISVFRYLLSYHQAFGDWKKFNLLNLTLNIIKVSSILIVFLLELIVDQEKNLLTYKTLLIILSMACLATFIITCYYSKGFYLINKIKTERNYIELKKELNRLIYPLFAINIVTVFAMRVDTLIIQKILGEQDLGVYSAANSLALVFPLITSSVMQVLLKDISGKSHFYLKRIIDFQKKYLSYIILMILLVQFLSNYLVPLIFGKEYERSIIYFQILIIVHLGGLAFTPLESYFYSKKTSLILILKIVQLVLIIIISLIFVRKYMLFAVVSSILFSRAFAWGYLYLISKRILKKKDV